MPDTGIKFIKKSDKKSKTKKQGALRHDLSHPYGAP
jgi:hypothetical protein